MSAPLFAPPPKPVTPASMSWRRHRQSARHHAARAGRAEGGRCRPGGGYARRAKLLSAYDIKKPLLRYDDHAGPKVLPEIIERLRIGQIVAQISDAAPR